MTSFDLAKREAARLAPAGWPRPWRRDYKSGERLPAPWITVLPEFAKMDPTRGGQMVRYRLCQVCGEGHEEGTDVVIFLDGGLRDWQTLKEVEFPATPEDPPPLGDFILKAHDGAMLHERCAKLAVGFCPFLKRAQAGNRLFAFAGPVSAIFTRTFEGRPTEVYMRGDEVRVWLMPEGARQ